MTYKGKVKDTVFPSADGEARVVSYLVVLIDTNARVFAVIHVCRPNHPRSYQLTSEREFDVAINRIVDAELRGISVDSMRLVVEVDQSSITRWIPLRPMLGPADHLTNRG